MQKNYVIRMLALLLTFVLSLTGCQDNGASSSSPSSSQPPSESSSVSESSKLEPVVLEYYMPEKEQPDAQNVWAEINEYVAEKINVTVNIHWVERAEYGQRMSAIIGAGQEFDLCGSPTSALNFAVNASNGAFAPLDELLSPYAPELLEEVPAWVLEGGRVNGKIYGVPSYKDVASSFGLCWNDTMRQELGIGENTMKTEWKWIPEMYDVFMEFKEKRDAVYPELSDIPIATAFHDNLFLWCSYDQVVNYVVTNVGNIDYFKDQGSGEKVFNLFDTPEFLEIAKAARKWVDAGLQPVAESNPDPDNVLRKAGKIPLNTTGGLVAIAEHDVSDDWVIKLNRSQIAISTTNYLQLAITAVSATSKNPDRAVMFMNLQYSDEYVATASRFGIEGVNYKLVKDAQGNDRLDFKGTNNEDPQNRAYYNWYGSQWGNLFKCTLPAVQPDNFYEKLEKMNQEASQFTTNLGFVFNQENVANEIAACATVIDEYRKPLMQGAFPADQIEAKVAQFVEKLNANGIQKIVDEAQKQLNEWRVANGKSTYEG